MRCGCVCSVFWLSPRQSWLECWDVCACVQALPVPHQSRLSCAVWVCASDQVSAAPGHSWLGFLGACVGVCAPLVARHSPLGLVVCGLGIAWHLLPCRGLLLVVRGSRGLRHPLAFVAWHLSVCAGFRWRRVFLTCLPAPRGAPRLVRSGPSRCSGPLSRRRGAFPYQGLSQPDLLGSCAGHVVGDREAGSCCLPLGPAEAGAWGCSAWYLFRASK